MFFYEMFMFNEIVLVPILPVDNTSSLLAGGAVFEVLASSVASPTRITENKLNFIP